MYKSETFYLLFSIHWLKYSFILYAEQQTMFERYCPSFGIQFWRCVFQKPKLVKLYNFFYHSRHFYQVLFFINLFFIYHLPSFFISDMYKIPFAPLLIHTERHFGILWEKVEEKIWSYGKVSLKVKHIHVHRNMANTSQK